VTRNLEVYVESLGEAPHSMTVQHGFLHQEPKGIRAIDQSGPRRVAKMKQTRLYTYADDETRTLHVLCVGGKDRQNADIQKAKKMVDEIQESKKAAKARKNSTKESHPRKKTKKDR